MKIGLILLCLAALVRSQIRLNPILFQTPPQKQIPQLYFASAGYTDSLDQTIVIRRGTRTAEELPSTFQYRVNCGADRTAPWVPDEEVARRVAYTTCSDLLQTLNIKVLTNLGSYKTVDVSLIPVPATQVWNGKTVESSLTGLSRGVMSNCCNEASCPDRCLLKEGGERCYLEIYMVDWTYEYSSISDLAVIFTGQPDYTKTGAGLQLVFRIPCLYCQVKSCNMVCDNGQVCFCLMSVILS